MCSDENRIWNIHKLNIWKFCNLVSDLRWPRPTQGRSADDDDDDNDDDGDDDEVSDWN